MEQKRIGRMVRPMVQCTHSINLLAEHWVVKMLLEQTTENFKNLEKPWTDKIYKYVKVSQLFVGRYRSTLGLTAVSRSSHLGGG